MSEAVNNRWLGFPEFLHQRTAGSRNGADDDGRKQAAAGCGGR
jgi:hypothetical protein